MITEVYPNVAADGTSLESYEWIEIHNLERHPVNLDGWTIEDAQAIAPLPAFELQGGESVLVVGRAADISVPAGRSLIILESRNIGTGLRNAGDRVALINPYGVRYDAVSWGDVRWPRATEPPNPRQSIIRNALGNQSISDRLTPWTLGEAISAEPERHRHPRPETSVRITRALIDPKDDEPETITIRNISRQPLITVNWTLTVNNSLIRLRSVRIEPGDEFDIQEPDGVIGRGLSSEGGHLVLRDSNGNWLSTASWGNDETFHRLPRAVAGEALHFSPFARIHPRVPWFDFERHNATMVSAKHQPKSLQGSTVASQVLRVSRNSRVQQDSHEAAIWISEVYPNAGQGRNDHSYEWFELTNSSNLPIPLDDWSIADNTSSDLLDGVIVPPNSSIAIGASELAGPEVVVAVTDGRIGNGLANSGDRLRLIDAAGEIVSAISWGDDRSYDAITAPDQEESVQRASPDEPPFVGKPSPGLLNPSPPAAPAPSAPDAQPPLTRRLSGADPMQPAQSESSPNEVLPEAELRLRITEILPAPLPGEPEWVEIHNPTDQSINLSGWSIGDNSRHTELQGELGAGAYLVVATKSLEIEADTIIVDRIGNGLNNDADTISVFAPDGRPVYEVSYGHDDLPAPAQGLSIAVEPERWTVTAHPTPGTAEVTPLLGDAVRSASLKTPVSDEGRLPIVNAPPEEGVNAWMIVSFALIGVILTLVIRRVQPVESAPEPEVQPATYNGPADESATLDHARRQNESDGP
ncbi:MAG: lamin tail domain-containing protein [Chloroflexi bacterium]|nr:lamin tail domain-containing protein [Chloroflexota bacterium]